MIVRPFRYLILAGIIAFVVYFAVTGTANARSTVNWPDARLDQAATAIAQKPVTVWCEDDDISWALAEIHFNAHLLGFTFLGTPIVFIDPQECGTLHAFLNGEDVGSYHVSLALLALTHEAVHQRLNSADEALTECTALKMLPSVLSGLFKVPATVDEQYLVQVVKKITVKVGSKRVVRRIKVLQLRTRTVPNVWYGMILRDAKRWDTVLPAVYHGGTC